MRKKISASGWRALASKNCAITGEAPAASGNAVVAAGIGAFIAATLTNPPPSGEGDREAVEGATPPSSAAPTLPPKGGRDPLDARGDPPDLSLVERLLD